MFEYILFVLKQLFLKVKYRNKLTMHGFSKCDFTSKIKVIDGELEVGKHFRMRDGSYIAVVDNGQFRIEDNVYINRNCSMICHEKITIGENTAIGPNVLMYDHDHCFGRNGIEDGFKSAPIVIEKNCWIGAGVIILRGTHIGEGTVIGAGTLVKGIIPSHSVVIEKKDSERSIVEIK